MKHTQSKAAPQPLSPARACLAPRQRDLGSDRAAGDSLKLSQKARGHRGHIAWDAVPSPAQGDWDGWGRPRALLAPRDEISLPQTRPLLGRTGTAAGGN